jgi:predicted phosphodiesterase
MKVTRRAIVIPDQHFPLHDEKAVNVVLKAIKIVKPSTFINLGDVGEWESVSAWRWKRKRKPPLEYQLPEVDKEIKKVNKQIDRFDEALDSIGCKGRYICAGNHDEWLTHGFVNEYPYLEDYTFLEACKWKERGYKYKEWNEPLKIGKITFIHGAYINQFHAKKHLMAYGENIMYGHTHDIQRHTLTRLGGTISSWSLGCLKDMSSKKNAWLKNRLHNWNHAFAVIDWFKNGDFIVNVVEIINGKTTLWGEMLKGD